MIPVWKMMGMDALWVKRMEKRKSLCSHILHLRLLLRTEELPGWQEDPRVEPEVDVGVDGVEVYIFGHWLSICSYLKLVDHHYPIKMSSSAEEKTHED
jgi:hypothetical protein